MIKEITTCAVLMLLATAEASIIDEDFNGGLSGWSWIPTQYAKSGMLPSIVEAGVIGLTGKAFRAKVGTDTTHFGQGLEEGGSIQQDVELISGASYRVSLDAAIHLFAEGPNTDGGLIRVYINNDLLWSWDVENIAANEPTLHNSYEGTYVPSYTGQHSFEVLMTRQWKNGSSRDTGSVFHYVDNILVEIMGDTNADNLVDIQDYRNLVAQFGGPPGLESADFDYNDIVNLDDFAVLRGNFGYHAPEPSTIVLLFSSVVIGLFRRPA